MVRRILDTSVLIDHWRTFRSRTAGNMTKPDAHACAEQLIRVQDTNWIVPPVEVEFLAGVRSQNELELAEAFLARFQVPENGEVRAVDWREARRLACRVPRDGKARDLGDCLIRAIASRIRAHTLSLDKRFPRRG